MTFDEVRRASNRLANVLVARGLVPGDRVAMLLPQVPETAIAHLAAYRAGVIAVPLFVLFGPDAHRVPARRFRRRGAGDRPR